MDEITASINKGGSCWLEVRLSRKAKGLFVWLRARPEVEEFFTTLSEGMDPSKLEDLTSNWKTAGDPIKVRNLIKPIDNNSYTLDYVGGGTSIRTQVNVSFLKFVGISSTEGITFIVPGPINKGQMTHMKEEILSTCRQLFRDFITPVEMNLRITSSGD